MKPRVFISSTYYDLKYVRESLLNFIEKKYEFEAVLFERGNIPYSFNGPIGSSCYNEVERCNMMILIVGGRNGTVDGNSEDFEKHKTFTQNEYRAAIKKNIPIFIFIDKNVYIEYKIYNNLKIKDDYSPVHVDNINIFEFIDELMGYPIRTFEKIEEIEEYLIEQWTGWFHIYLESLENEKYKDLNAEINFTLEKLKNSIDAMANSVLTDEQKVMVKEQEKVISLKNYAQKISECILFVDNYPSTDEAYDFCNKFITTMINVDVLKKFKDTSINRFEYFEKLIADFNKTIKTSIHIKTIDFKKLFNNSDDIINLLTELNTKNELINLLSLEFSAIGE